MIKTIVIVSAHASPRADVHLLIAIEVERMGFLASQTLKPMPNLIILRRLTIYFCIASSFPIAMPRFAARLMYGN